MKKRTLARNIFFGLCLGACLLTPMKSTPIQTQAYSYVNTIKASKVEVNISNTNLRNALCNLLGKSTSDKLYSTDFLNHEDYKSREETDTETGVTQTVANKNCLDLSGYQLEDITELVQFELPETLVAIDLSENNFTTSGLNSLSTILNSTTDSTITYGESELTIRTDFNVLIKKVNLVYNLIDLDNVSQSDLTNEKFIYGIQNAPSVHSSGLIMPSEVDSKYYIKSNDFSYLTFTFKHNSEITSPVENSIQSLVSSSLGTYSFEIKSVPKSTTSYFYGFDKTISFNLFTAEIDSNFTVERKSLFTLPADKILINGINDAYSVSYSNASTKEIGSQYVTITITLSNGDTRAIPLTFIVVDTTKPTITLKGQSTMYASQNREFIDPGYTAEDSGDNLTASVVVTSNVDITKLGTYEIKYNVKDISGNSADEVIRTVIIEEQVLDRITIRTTNDNLYTNKDITLVVEPDEGIPTSNYTDYIYKWYMDGVLFQTTTGDSITGKSMTTINISTASTKQITVTLSAKQKIDDKEIIVYSEALFLDIELQISQNDALIWASAIAVLLIIIIITIITIIKRRKSRSKTSQKSKKKDDKSKPSQTQNIQVIKDYDPSNDNNNTNFFDK